MLNKYDCLNLNQQMCFPIYVCSKEIVRCYRDYLDEINLTYTQYIVMLFLWDNDKVNIKSLGETLYLDSGTLTPLLKKLENKGLIIRDRLKNDERNLVISLTKKGWDLRDKVLDIPDKVASVVGIDKNECSEMLRIINKILNNIKENRK